MADQAATGENVRVEDDRTGLSTKAMTIALKDNLYFTQGKYEQIATKNDWYMALAYTIRDRLVHSQSVLSLRRVSHRTAPG
jgi:starch phosphorylase